MDHEDRLNEDRKRAEAYQALAHPAGDASPPAESLSPILLTHDGEVYEQPEPEDILEGLDRDGLDPREPKGAGQ